MHARIRWSTAFALLLSGSGVWAHYHMLLPQMASAKRDQLVSIVYQWGHPFEHELFDAVQPESLVVYRPDGKSTELSKTLQKFDQQTAAKKIAAYRFPFTPDQRGDYTFVLTTPPVLLEQERVFLQDRVKVVLHVQTQKGWDIATGKGFELVPLTRPYGLEPGVVFQCQALFAGKLVPGALVEIERYNATPPKMLPPDEQITRKVKTDPNGIVTCTLTEPGWWCVSAIQDGGKWEHQGKEYPLKQRALFWVHVDAKP